MDMNKKKSFLMMMGVMCFLITSISFYNFTKTNNFNMNKDSNKPHNLFRSQLNDDDQYYKYKQQPSNLLGSQINDDAYIE